MPTNHKTNHVLVVITSKVLASDVMWLEADHLPIAWKINFSLLYTNLGRYLTESAKISRGRRGKMRRWANAWLLPYLLDGLNDMRYFKHSSFLQPDVLGFKA